ncbi:MAG: hypothetical protein ACK42Y_01260 [Candidatus Thermochlorobacter sp.]
MLRLKTILLIFLAMMIRETLFAQPSQPDSKDVASLDAILAALYDVISGDAGKPRDWHRFRSLFAPGARLMPIVQLSSGKDTLRVMTPDDYVESGKKRFAQRGFFEKEIARRTERYGNLVHVFSTYEAREQASDEKPFMRGINSIQLLYDRTRWYIVSVMWQAESAEFPLPEKYLKTVP